jgi:hypothetical protein
MPRLAKTTARGLGTPHQRAKAKWKPTVDAGLAYCHAKLCLMPTRWIDPTLPWDMGHTEDRTAHTGPEHPRCNRTEGAIRGNRNRNAIRRPYRRWAL